MKTIHQITAGTAMALLSTFCSAATLNAATITKFTSLYKFGAGYEFEMWGAWQIPACGSATSIIVGRSANDDIHTVKAAYATVLAAYTAGSTIALDVTCNGTTLIANNVYLPSR